MPSTVIVDSGPLLAAANSADPSHRACLGALGNPRFELVIPALCVAEVAYLLAHRRGPKEEETFIRSLAVFDVRAPMSEDWVRIADLIEKYSDFPLGTVDAAVISLAERLDTDLILTLDRRHFSAVRPRHCASFRLLP